MIPCAEDYDEVCEPTEDCIATCLRLGAGCEANSNKLLFLLLDTPDEPIFVSNDGICGCDCKYIYSWEKCFVSSLLV